MDKFNNIGKYVEEKGHDAEIELDLKNLAYVEITKKLFSKKCTAMFVYDDNVNCRVTIDKGVFNKNNLNEVIESIQNTMNIHTGDSTIKQHKNRIVISNKRITDRMLSNIQHQSNI